MLKQIMPRQKYFCRGINVTFMTQMNRHISTPVRQDYSEISQSLGPTILCDILRLIFNVFCDIEKPVSTFLLIVVVMQTSSPSNTF